MEDANQLINDQDSKVENKKETIISTVKIEESTKAELSDVDDQEVLLEVFTITQSNEKEKNEILGDVHVELQISPMKALEAVLTSSTEHDTLMSDDDTPKVLTTLETVKKVNPSKEKEEVQETQTNKQKEPEIKESKKDNGGKFHRVVDSKQEDEIDFKTSEIARKQLESLNKVPKIPRTKLKSAKPKGTPDKVEECVSEMKALPQKHSELYIQVLNDKGESSVKLPCHILGRNKEHPELDPLSNGRNAAKPRQGVKVPSVSLSSSILSKKEVEQAINDKIKSKPKNKFTGNFQILEHRVLNLSEQIPISPIKPDLNKSGGIEIPHELILGQEITLSSNECDNVESEENNQDLIAILEGEDDDNLEEVKIEEYMNDGTMINEYHIVLNVDEPQKEVTFQQQKIDNDKELERAIALRQMMNLPKPKGKKKTKTPEQPKPVKRIVKKSVTTELVDSLVQDWSDTEVKIEEKDQIEKSEDKNEIISLPVAAPVTVQLKNKKKPISVSNTVIKESEQLIKTPIEIQPPFKRTRIIKKKIIWDPDAPETQFSYASLINTSAKKAIVKKTVLAVKPPPEIIHKNETASVTILNNKRSSDGSVSPQSIKKKKLSEIDKLLGDEGAIKMIYSLERENNNADVPEIDTEIDSDLVDISKKRKDLASKAKVIRNVVMKQGNSNNAAPTTPRARIKRDVTSPRILNIKKDMAKKKVIGPKGVKSESWDYVYKQRGGDDSMIIRRRSNSSYSSTSPRRLSLDQSLNTTDNTSSTIGESICKKLKGKTFEFAKPNVRKEIRTGESTTSVGHHSIIEMKEKYEKALAKTGVEIVSTGTRRSTRGHIESKNISPVKPIKIVEVKPKTKPIEVKEVLITRLQNYVQLTLMYASGKLNNFITVQCITELISALKSLETDDTCNAVLITSDKKSSNGLDFTSLIQNNLEKRKMAAQELGDNVYNFFTTLINFSKPLICGVQGVISGLGVVILPLFDMVISDGTAIFETNFAKIGQIPEGYSIVLQSNKIKSCAITDLFLLCQSLTSSSALETGLITHIVNATEFQQELLRLTSVVASHSTQALKSMKTQQRHLLNEKLIASSSPIFVDEKKLLIQHWISNECQEKFKTYLTTEKW